PSDNSNTQFALLALWVAGRHKVPTERALALVARRFKASQNKEGGWLYFHHPNQPQISDAMICAGLLGLAVGHGLDSGAQRSDSAVKKVDDPSVKQAFEALSKCIGTPKGPNAERPRGDKKT